MISFFTMYMLLYGGMNLAFVMKVREAYSPSLVSASLIGAWCTLMVAGPMLVRTLEGRGHAEAATGMAYLSYGWMGLILVFFSLAIIFDGYRLAVHGAKAISLLPAIWSWTLSARAAFLIPAISAALINAYGFYAAWDIKPKHIEVHTAKLSVPSLRVVQISDVHLGLMIGQKKLEKILSIIREAGPDVLVSTGDLVDGGRDDIAALQAPLASATARYGKFAITGNHEMYAGLDNSIEFTVGAGFKMLRDEVANIPSAGLSIIGIDYRRAGWDAMPQIRKGPFSEAELINTAPADTFRLVLKHVPIIDPATVGTFDLQLSGHTHGGQIFPFYIPVRMVFKYIAGLYDLGKGSLLYVSRGTGTWGPSVRVLSPPEVTVIDIVRDRAVDGKTR